MTVANFSWKLNEKTAGTPDMFPTRIVADVIISRDDRRPPC